VAVREVADNGAGDDHGGSGREGGGEAEGREDGHCGGEGGGGAGDGVESGGDDEGQSAAVAVGEGALGDLAEGEACEEGSEGVLGGAGGSVKGGLDGREGGEVHVDGGRADGGEQAEKEG
jgi:hypothetical protein